MTFGQKLREARQKAALSQEELAQTISVSRSAIAREVVNDLSFL